MLTRRCYLTNSKEIDFEYDKIDESYSFLKICNCFCKKYKLLHTFPSMRKKRTKNMLKNIHTESKVRQI